MMSQWQVWLSPAQTDLLAVEFGVWTQILAIFCYHVFYARPCRCPCDVAHGGSIISFVCIRARLNQSE